MASTDDPLVERLKRKKQEQDEARAARQASDDARREAAANYREAFRKLLAIPQERLEDAARKAEMKITVRERGDAVEFELGENNPVSFRLQNLGERAGAGEGEVGGAAYFTQASGPQNLVALNSCNFLYITASADAPSFWRGARFRLSGGVPGDRVAASLNLGATPGMEDAFGLRYAELVYRNESKAERMMHSVKVEYEDDVGKFIEEIIAKALA